MQTAEKTFAFMFILIGAFLIFTSGGAFNTIISAIGKGVTNTTEDLQGRG